MQHNFVSCCMFSNANHQELVTTNQLISELEGLFSLSRVHGWPRGGFHLLSIIR